MTGPAWQIIQGDALEVLRALPDQHVQCCVTSPPYWALRDYGVDGQLGLEETPEEYIEKMVEIGGQRYALDILFRMLTPAELAAAHSFPADYGWTGSKADVIKQIGNSVPVATAQAICAAVIDGLGLAA